MTTFRKLTVRCFCCGMDSSQHILSSTNRMGSPDLDQRPPEMMRSTMGVWLQECPSCGYVANDLQKGDAGDPQRVRSEAYQGLRAGPHASGLSCRFLLGAELARSRNDMDGAFSRTLSAAWIADDLGMLDLARGLRQQAAGHVLSKAASPDLRLRLVDVLRRAAAWDDAGRLATEMMAEPLEYLLPKLVRFQLKKIRERNDSCFSVAEALAEPDTTEPDDLVDPIVPFIHVLPPRRRDR